MTTLKHALIHAGATAAYVSLVVSGMMFAGNMIQGPDSDNIILVPIIMLLLFVTSAAITGSLVFGRPILWYLDGKKKEAIQLLVYTLAFLVLILVFSVTLLYALQF